MVVSLQLLDLDDGIDHLRGDALGANELVHLLLGLELGGLELAHGVHALLAGQLLRSAATHTISEGLNLFLVNGSLCGLHEVNLSGLLEDLLGDLKGLVKVGLDQSVGELLPVGGG